MKISITDEKIVALGAQIVIDAEDMDGAISIFKQCASANQSSFSISLAKLSDDQYQISATTDLDISDILKDFHLNMIRLDDSTIAEMTTFFLKAIGEEKISKYCELKCYELYQQCFLNQGSKDE